MKILMINVVCGVKSTGRICTDLAEELEKRGHKVKIAYGRGQVPKRHEKYALKIGNNLSVRLHAIYARIFDASGYGSYLATKRLIRWIKKYDPDVIHLHNLHGYYLNLPLLFNYLKGCGKRVVWTLHDCWPITGHCCYFDYCKCMKWKSCCGHCPQKREYPQSLLLDRSLNNLSDKKQLFTGIANMTLVTPSKWLASYIHESYLSCYEIDVIHNWVNSKTFYPHKGNFKKEKSIKGKMIIGVAAIWDKRKGLEDLIKLNGLINPEDRIVIVGLTKQQIEKLPLSIIGINRTENVQVLADIYASADIYVNTSLEDNYPSTNLEAIACGTPVVSYDTGGCGESAELYGIKVPKGDIQKLKKAVYAILDGKIKLNYPDVAGLSNNSIKKYVKVLEGT
ncbi:glycosyltransferase [Sharpea azabuensis]|uniref:glycosyltransferase n=1 Tax=Sharpea azabuensis TaxID=322505 RepID=UPI0013DA4B9F|nr:glycosyltransferase [Sharpea azabuensis]